jgi:glycosyltransferase involved in cell wall biosynthesis
MTVKVAILYAPELNIGGVEELLKALFRLAPADYEWVVFAPVSKVFEDSIKARAQIVPWKLRRIWDLPASFRLAKLFKQHKISLVHANSPEVTVIAKIAAWFAGIPSVVTIHLSPSDYFQGASRWARVKKSVYLWGDVLISLALGTHIIFNSQQTKKEETRKYPYSLSRSHVVYNGADIKNFTLEKNRRAENRELFLNKLDATVITFVGRLEYQKGLDLLLPSFQSLSQTHQNLALWLIGGGSKEGELIEYVQKSGLSNVRFFGPREDVAKILAASDIFVLPSRYETMPIALLEAMAVGLACVATTVGENELVITHEVNGLLVPPENEADLSQALERMVTDPALRVRLGSAAAESVEQYSFERMVDGVTSVYKAALRQRN